MVTVEAEEGDGGGRDSGGGEDSGKRRKTRQVCRKGVTCNWKPQTVTDFCWSPLPTKDMPR